MATFDIVSTLCEKCPCPCCGSKLTWICRKRPDDFFVRVADLQAACLRCGITLGFWRNAVNATRYPGSPIRGGELMESWRMVQDRWRREDRKHVEVCHH